MSNIEKISFSDCPYKCNNGVVFNPVTKVKIPCPHCSEKRKKIAQGLEKDEETGKTLSEMLRIPISLTGMRFDPNGVVLRETSHVATPESLENVKATMSSLVSNVTLGVNSEYSIVFNFGGKANISAFVYPYLMQAYKAGLSVAPMVYALDLVAMRLEFEGDYLQHKTYKWGDDFRDYIKADVCVVVIDAGASILDILAVKGLMQLRASRRQPTIIITEQWSRHVKTICTEEPSLYLASLCSVQFRGRDSYVQKAEGNMSTGDIPTITEQQFSDFFKSNNVL